MTLPLFCSSGGHGGVAHGAAAAEDDLSAGLVPAGGQSLGFGRGIEPAGVVVHHVDLGTHLGGSGVSALHEAVAIADHGGDSLAAQEAQLGVAVLDGGVTGQVAHLLLGEEDADGVVSGLVVAGNRRCEDCRR